jgi:hypothetical protein
MTDRRGTDGSLMRSGRDPSAIPAVVSPSFDENPDRYLLSGTESPRVALNLFLWDA